jgi:hypothetical protein
MHSFAGGETCDTSRLALRGLVRDGDDVGAFDMVHRR